VRHKFHAIPDNRDGFRFASKKEARFYDELKLRQKTGEVLFFLMQTPFHLPGNVKYVCDFQVFYVDGSVEFIDVKGALTQLFIDKKKFVEQHYPVEIKVVK
jgi:hypothetical protein